MVFNYFQEQNSIWKLKQKKYIFMHLYINQKFSKYFYNFNYSQRTPKIKSKKNIFSQEILKNLFLIKFLLKVFFNLKIILYSQNVKSYFSNNPP